MSESIKRVWTTEQINLIRELKKLGLLRLSTKVVEAAGFTITCKVCGAKGFGCDDGPDGYFYSEGHHADGCIADEISHIDEIKPSLPKSANYHIVFDCGKKFNGEIWPEYKVTCSADTIWRRLLTNKAIPTHELKVGMHVHHPQTMADMRVAEITPGKLISKKV